MLVGPGVKPIKKRELEEGKVLDLFIKGIRQRRVENAIVFVAGIPDEVEIANHEPGKGE
jgi:hypothetical protein